VIHVFSWYISGANTNNLKQIPTQRSIEYLQTGRRPSIRFEVYGENLNLYRTPATITELRELMSALQIVPESHGTFQERQKNGRPAEPLPTDIKPLLETFRNADELGRPFFRTGKQGVYSRRYELPTEWQGIGCDRLEREINRMIMSGKVIATDGKLSVPDNSIVFLERLP